MMVIFANVSWPCLTQREDQLPVQAAQQHIELEEPADALAHPGKRRNSEKDHAGDGRAEENNRIGGILRRLGPRLIGAYTMLLYL